MDLVHLDILKRLEKDLSFFSQTPAVDRERLTLGLYPPLCVTDTKLVWGFSLLEEAMRQGVSRLWCRKTEGDFLYRLKIALLCEGRVNGYALSEKARILEYLENNKMLDRAEEIISLVQTKGSFIAQAAAYRSLPEEARVWVDTNLLDLKHAHACFCADRGDSLPPSVLEQDRELLAAFSFSERKEFLALLKETVLRVCGGNMDKIYLEELLASLYGSSSPLEKLRGARYPYYTESLKRFESIRGGIFEGSGIKLIAPHNFEGSSYGVEFSFGTKEKLKQVVMRLTQALDYTDELFSILG